MLTGNLEIGARVEDIETPALVIDIEALDHNFSVVSEMYDGKVCKMRQHAKNIKSPVVLQRQIDAGGTLGGVCTAKIAEAEVMIQGGIKDVLVTSEVVGPDKLRRLAALAKHANIKVCIDNLQNVKDLSEAAVKMSSEIGVLIEVDTSMNRAGVRSPGGGVALAKVAASLPGIKFLGVMSHQTVGGWADRETRFTEGRRYIEICLKVKRAIEAEGIPVVMVSSGETFSYDVAPEIEGVTEVEGGTYALMSASNRYMEDFAIAGKIITRVIDVKEKYAFIDAGRRCLGGPMGVTPVVEGHEDVKFVKMEESSSVLMSEDRSPFAVGEVLHLLSNQQDIMVNRWDEFIVLRNDVVEAVWDIPARGCHH